MREYFPKLMTVFGSLFLAFGKRFGEALQLGIDAPSHRGTLEHYQPAFLEQMLTLALTGLMLSFCLWAAQYPTDGRSISLVALQSDHF